MQIEIGLVAAAALAGTAIQLRVLALLQIKLKQIKMEQKRRNEEVEARAAERFAEIEKDLVRWERDHGHGRDASRQALLRKTSLDDPSSPDGNDSTLGKQRHSSGISELLTPTNEKMADQRQSTGLLPLLNLGDDLVQGLSGSDDNKKDASKEKPAVAEEVKPASNRRASWLLDFEDIRKSIDWLKSDTPTPSEGNRSRKVSFLSRTQTPSQNMTEGPSANASQPRPRVHSMNALSDMPQTTSNTNRERANSTPLRDDEWDAYVRERKLFTPPTGPTDLIPVSERPRSSLGLVPIPESVRKAADERLRRESLFELGGSGDSQMDLGDSTNVLTGLPAEPPRARHRSQSIGHIPVEILPPRRQSRPEERPTAGRTRTFEELAERHKRKMSDLQRPLTEAEREQADLDNAKQRWENSHRIEKREYERRQTESQKRSSQLFRGKPDNRLSRQLGGQSTERQSIPFAPAHLSSMGGRRSSTAKVLNWQQQQQNEVSTDSARAVSPPAGHSRQSRQAVQDPHTRSIPFPQSSSRNRNQNAQ